jgi:molecular chaperone Hsp33
VIVDDHGAVVRAGGVLVQAMPGGEPELIRDVQHQLRTGVLYRAMAEDAPADGETLARAILDDLALDFLEQRPIAFKCRCSAERATQMLALLDLDEIDDMIAREGQAEITCNFCSERYLIDKSALEAVRHHISQRGPREKN